MFTSRILCTFPHSQCQAGPVANIFFEKVDEFYAYQKVSDSFIFAPCQMSQSIIVMLELLNLQIPTYGCGFKAANA